MKKKNEQSSSNLFHTLRRILIFNIDFDIQDRDLFKEQRFLRVFTFHNLFGTSDANLEYLLIFKVTEILKFFE